MICPYCKQEIPGKDFAAKSPQGNYFHMPCADMVLDDWMKAKEEVEILRKALDIACRSGNFDNGISNMAAQTGISLYGLFFIEAKQSLGRGKDD